MLRSAIKAVALALVACSVASAQEAQKWEGKPRTKLEAFLGTSGAVIIRGRTEVGTVGAKDAARVLAVTLRNASTAEETKGIVIEVSQPSAGSRSAAKSFVDYDEIAGLIEGIDHVVQVDRKVTGFAHVEATYSTRDDVRVLVFFDRAGRQQAFVKVGAKSTSMEMAELAEFKRLILLAKIISIIRKLRQRSVLLRPPERSVLRQRSVLLRPPERSVLRQRERRVLRRQGLPHQLNGQRQSPRRPLAHQKIDPSALPQAPGLCSSQQRPGSFRCLMSAANDC